MAGFFSKEETKADIHIAKRAGCGTCGLNKQCTSPKFPAVGDGQKRILIIDEVPSATEDRTGEALSGDSHQRLRRVLRKQGIHIEIDCWKTNAVLCRPIKDGKSRVPSNNEIDACRPQLLKYIAEVKPHVIIPLGTAAMRALIGHRWKKDFGSIDKWRGFTIPDRELKAWICPTFSASYILQQDKNPAVEKVWAQDIKKALKKLDLTLPHLKDERECVEIVHDEKLLIKYLSAVYWNEVGLNGLDYETTGLKPHREGQQIVCCALAPDPDWAFSFNMPTKGKALSLLKKILAHPRVGKVAHNAKFEDAWTYEKLGVEMQGWRWDTMLSARAIDNRTNIASLKFVAYIEFGLIDYDSHLEHLLRPTDEEKAKHGANSINRVMQIPREELLLYMGIDALLCRRLEPIQQRRISDAVETHQPRSK